jgi:hypothetical protein
MLVNMISEPKLTLYHTQKYVLHNTEIFRELERTNTHRASAPCPPQVTVPRVVPAERPPLITWISCIGI